MKKITIILSLIFLSLLSLPISANDNKLVDEYGCLSSSEKQELEQLINDEINKVGFDIVVYIAYQDRDDITALADDYYDYNGYGLGSDNDGLILCINYYNRDYTITTCGHNTITLFADEALDNDVYPNITSYLKNGDNYNAIKAFVSGIDYVYTNPDRYYHEYHEYSAPKANSTAAIKMAGLAGLGGSAIICLIVFLVLRGQLKTQGIKKQANQYMDHSSLNLFRSGDIFLYKSQSRTRIQSDNHSGSGGSHTHISSSGVSHGGGGSHHF